mmetsp:Transcript_12647/g.18449  ORF Transcript_12647/g.18449 Transcript_12647/m.18449 type:complete len:203 (+) Transcript_12647:454-1062(+)
MPRHTSLNPITNLRLAFELFLRALARSWRRISSPKSSKSSGTTLSSSMRLAYSRDPPAFGIFGARLHSAYFSGITLSPEYIGSCSVDGTVCGSVPAFPVAGVSPLLLTSSRVGLVPVSIVEPWDTFKIRADILQPPIIVPFSSFAAIVKVSMLLSVNVTDMSPFSLPSLVPLKSISNASTVPNCLSISIKSPFVSSIHSSSS